MVGGDLWCFSLGGLVLTQSIGELGLGGVGLLEPYPISFKDFFLLFLSF